MSVIKGTILAELESIPVSYTISAVSQEPESEPSDEHRHKLWEMVGEQSLSEGEKAQLFELLLEYHTLFAIRDGDLRHTSRVQHRIDTGETPQFTSLCGACHSYGAKKLRICLMTC